MDDRNLGLGEVVFPVTEDVDGDFSMLLRNEDVRAFYKFVFENDLRLEAIELLERRIMGLD